MPLFKPRPDSPDALAPAPAPARKPTTGSGLFSHRCNRSASPLPSPPISTAESDYRSATSGRSGFFFPRPRHHASLDSLATATTSHTLRTTNSTHTTHTPDTPRTANTSATSFLGFDLSSLRGGNPGNDPHVLAAREKVATAAAAEHEAARMLLHARARVRDALEHVKGLQLEAQEEADHAKAKHAEAKVVSRDTVIRTAVLRCEMMMVFAV
ncbi:hypothetical protein DFH09DRAFT_1332391 [Mycena vulgaris]|nr:hypothetical protein DFH09DRAFT_1332391 [Mycena vulgaris]